MRNSQYGRRESLAIHDFLVEQQAQVEEYIHDAQKLHGEKPEGTTRMRVQWARKIASYLEHLVTGVEETIKDVK